MVKVPLAILRTDDGSYVHRYAGEPVPDNVSADDIDRLVAEGALGDGESEADAEPDDDDDAEPAEVARPAGNASWDAWAEYAVQSGKAKANEVRNLSRDEIRDRFGH